MDHQRLGQACESASGQAAILQPDHGGRNAAGLRIKAGRLRLILVPFKSGWVTENLKERLQSQGKRASQLHPAVSKPDAAAPYLRLANRRQADADRSDSEPFAPGLVGVPSAPPMELVDRVFIYPVRAGGLPGFVLPRDRAPLDSRVCSAFRVVRTAQLTLWAVRGLTTYIGR